MVAGRRDNVSQIEYLRLLHYYYYCTVYTVQCTPIELEVHMFANGYVIKLATKNKLGMQRIKFHIFFRECGKISLFLINYFVKGLASTPRRVIQL